MCIRDRVILWIICRKNIAQTEALFYFGLFAMIIGAWALNETDLATLLIEDRKIASLIGYMLLMIMSVPFIPVSYTHLEWSVWLVFWTMVGTE